MVKDKIMIHFEALAQQRKTNFAKIEAALRPMVADVALRIQVTQLILSRTARQISKRTFARRIGVMLDKRPACRMGILEYLEGKAHVEV